MLLKLLLGATRARILLIQAIEFGLLALILAAIALAIGAGAGWYVVVELFELPWDPIGARYSERSPAARV